ncbi:hypothetical protein HanPI659440_Chr05g0212081 [Helianthus annuus]|nr:hypothetical protein HanPI659440_Chr05g0212081 [Helianthus annuus]
MLRELQMVLIVDTLVIQLQVYHSSFILKCFGKVYQFVPLSRVNVANSSYVLFEFLMIAFIIYSDSKFTSFIPQYSIIGYTQVQIIHMLLAEGLVLEKKSCPSSVQFIVF